MAVITYPSWAYNSAGQPAVIVQNAAQFAALPLPGTWQLNGPYPASTTGTSDPGFTVTDTRLQQMLVESRVQTLMMAQAFNVTDDPVTLQRPDVLANDSSLTS